jgi:hypothetical protein
MIENLAILLLGFGLGALFGSALTAHAWRKILVEQIARGKVFKVGP